MRHTDVLSSPLAADDQFILKTEIEETEVVLPEVPLTLEDCDKLMKWQFISNETFDDINFEFNDDFEDLESPKKNETKKNKRKNLTPQRAVQSEIKEGEEKIKSECDFNTDEDADDSINEISEDSIFKGIKEEADGEVIDENILHNVKEEFRSHLGIKCNMCEKMFSYKTEFDTHYKENYRTTPVYTCSFCNRSLEKYSTFRSHCYRHITEDRYKCKECSKGFSLQSLLHVHMLAKHTRAKPFSCEECGKSFVTKPGLKIHLKKHKNEFKEVYPCVECGKVLHTRGGLTSHMNVHRLGRRFMCDVCGKTFTQKVNMQQHVKQHTGDKPYECDKCGKTFTEKSHLSRHYSFHSEQRPFKCEVCQKMYKTERCLKVHSMVHAKERPYICTYCSKGFLSSTKLKQHYNIHTGERPYACKYCERKFTNYPNWLKHTRRRHNVDHKTGEHLPPKPAKAKPTKTIKQPEVLTVTKLEPSPTPVTVVNVDDSPNIPDIPIIDETDLVMHDNIMTDFTLSKTEELLLQQGLFNFPITADEKFLLQQDVLATSSSSNLLVPFIQTQLPTHHNIIMQTAGQSSSQLQLNDYVPIQYIQ